MTVGVSGILKVLDRKLLDYAANWGEYRRNYLCIRIYLIAIIILLCTAIYYIQQSLFYTALGCFVQAVLYSYFIYLFYKGKMLLAKNITFLITNAFVFVMASQFGRQAYEHLSLVPLVISSVFFYSDREFKYMIAMLSLTVVNLICLELTDYSLFLMDDAGVYDFSYKKGYIVWVTLGISFYMLYELLHMNTNMEEKLKRLNNNLQLRNARLKKSNEDLDSFVYRASHDLRSPLASIMGVISIAKTETDVNKIKDYMKYQERSVKKLDDLIQDVLDLSRNSKLDIIIEPVSLKECLQHCADNFSYLEEFKSVKLNIDITEELIVYSDSRRLKVIFNNLISNALRYHDPLKQAYLNITATVNKGLATVAFKDNGIGIQEEHQYKVFEMFYRATDVKNGSGLGLYIVKDALEKLGGSIDIVSKYGEGTTITMTIPNQEKEVKRTPHHVLAL